MFVKGDCRTLPQGTKKCHFTKKNVLSFFFRSKRNVGRQLFRLVCRELVSFVYFKQMKPAATQHSFGCLRC